jgi:signal recognition particle receptor subunit beta
MFINRKLRELNLKIVYYGPALSGKTTNLEYVHAHTNPRQRGDLVSLKTREDRTIFFDYLQLELGQIKGLTPKFNLYTVPGQVYYAASRKLVLQGADGIVFVADSQYSRMQANLESYQNMFQHLRDLGMSPQAMPLVVQFNKRDLKDIVPVHTLRTLLGLNGSIPCYESVATQGMGVFDTLKAIIAQVISHARQGL